MQKIKSKQRRQRTKVTNSQKNVHYTKVYRADRWARYLITAGGYGIIVSILAILLFLVYQSLPLAKGASVEEIFSISLDNNTPKILLTGIDSYQEVFYELDESGALRFYTVADKQLLLKEQFPLLDGEMILNAAKGSLTQEIISLGTNAGRAITAEIKFTAKYSQDDRAIIPSLEILDAWQLETLPDSLPVRFEKLAFRQNEDLARFWCWQDQQGNVRLKIYDADEAEEYIHIITANIGEANITAMSISYNGENLTLATESGTLIWFDLSDFENISLKEQWQPSDAAITAINYLLGDQALVIGNSRGEVEAWFPVRTPANIFKFRKIHTFESHTSAIHHIIVSPRNRNFLTIDMQGAAKLHFSTTGKTQVEFKPGEYPILAGSFSPKANGIVVVDSKKNFGFYDLENPHPESTLKSLFGKVWYEGYPQSEFVWQSTGGTDEFESKLSLIPLIFGTLKGTLYAMLFSIPIAILAAIYVAQFAPRRLARSIKPTIEIMAALPSVVVGFLAGLYFSPVFEESLMTIFLLSFWLPLVFLACIFAWRMVPEERRVKAPLGWEILLMIPAGALALLLSYIFAQPVENLVFDGNFQQWLYSNLGITYQTRNSLVVGFALGFAVIPIIFTVSEDALSNVPESLTSASLALGASRWQTVRRIVLPAASGGIFAAIMLGLGRAVGETMIVLMATGNTPILDLNPFNGFRAMSANIAVEIPEAPVGGTLYRILFLTALLLFVFTFVLNTLSSLIGDKLRKKYARF